MRTGLWCAGVAAAVLLGGVASAQTKMGSTASSRDLALVGVTEIGDRVEAWLMDTRTHRRVNARPGEQVFGFRVKRVGSDRVVLADGKREVVLRLGDRAIPLEAPVPRSTPVVEIPERRPGETARAFRARVNGGPITLPRSGNPSEVDPDAMVPEVDITTPGVATSQLPVYPVGPDVQTPAQNYAVDPRLFPYSDPVTGYPYGYPVYPDERLLSPFAVAPYPGWGIENPLYPEWTGLARPFDRVVPWNTPAWGQPGDPRFPYASPAAPRNPQTGRRQGWTSYPARGMSAGRSPAPNPQTLRRRGQLFGPDISPSRPGYYPDYPR